MYYCQCNPLGNKETVTLCSCGEPSPCQVQWNRGNQNKGPAPGLTLDFMNL